MDESSVSYFNAPSSTQGPSINPDIAGLKQLILLEKASDDILPYKEAAPIIEKVDKLVLQQESTLDGAESEMTTDLQVFADIYRLEIERVKYLLKMFFRVRLQK